MTCYLVTGGAGFIGSNFIRYILAHDEDAQVVNMDALTYAGNLENLHAIETDGRYVFAHADIRNRSAIRNLLEEYRPDCIVNFAAESHVDRSIESPACFADTNVMGTVALLDEARLAWDDGRGGYGDHRFLQVSTDEVYGSLPLDDDRAFFYETTPLSPHSPYSASKASADMFVHAYADTFGLPVNITRCSNNYGPYQFPEKLIPLAIQRALAHEPIPVYGDGLNVRDWLYVDDHCKAIALVLAKADPGEVFNVGGHNEKANIDVVRLLVGELARATEDEAITEDLIAFVEDRKGHDRRYAIAPNLISARLGWYPETPFDEGIVYTVSWYLENRAWVQHIMDGSYRFYQPTVRSNDGTL